VKTPLRGEMLRGADFIIEVVSARGPDPIQQYASQDVDLEN